MTTNYDSVTVNGRVEYLQRKVVITSAQLLALNAIPQTVIPAPGAGKIIEFMSVVVHKPAGTAYAGIVAGEDIAFKYTDGSGAQVNTSGETTGFLDQTTAQTRLFRQIAAEYTPVANAALVMQLLVGEITTGDSPLYVSINYRVIDDATTADVSVKNS